MECGRTVSPFPHAHSTSVVDLTMARKTPPSLQRTLHSLYNGAETLTHFRLLRILSIVCSSSCIGRVVFYPHAGAGILLIFHAQDFLVLLTQFFSMDFVDGVGRYFPHILIRGLLWSPLRYSVFCWGLLYILGMGVCSFSCTDIYSG